MLLFVLISLDLAVLAAAAKERSQGQPLALCRFYQSDSQDGRSKQNKRNLLQQPRQVTTRRVASLKR